MNILPLSPHDVPVLAALQPAGWPDILPALEFYTQSSFCFPLKAVVDNRIAGIGTGIVHGDTGWLGHIIVHPGYRNQGVGGAVTQAVMTTLQAKGCTTLYLVATDLGAPVYAKAGFETEAQYLFFKDIAPADDRYANEYTTPFCVEHKRHLAELDRLVSGEDRMVQLERCLEGCQVYQRGNAPEGFYLPALGEGLIVAATPAAGTALMKLRLATHSQAAFPEDNVVASRMLYDQGYKEFRTAKRMRLGKKRSWQPENLYNRIAGNIG
jgi:GNAT superfamily N-acetyltransferase